MATVIKINCFKLKINFLKNNWITFYWTVDHSDILKIISMKKMWKNPKWRLSWRPLSLNTPLESDVSIGVTGKIHENRTITSTYFFVIFFFLVASTRNIYVILHPRPFTLSHIFLTPPPPTKNILWNMKRCRAAADTNIFINRWRGGRFYANVFFLFVSGGLRREILFRLPSCYTSYEL